MGGRAVLVVPPFRLGRSLALPVTMARDLSPGQELIVVVFAQFGACYLAAYGGAVLARRRAERRRSEGSVSKPEDEDAEGD